MDKSRNCSSGAISPLSHSIFNIYISKERSLITYSFVKFGCMICIFLNSENLICRSTDILKCFRSLFNFEITRVGCIYNCLQLCFYCSFTGMYQLYQRRMVHKGTGCHNNEQARGPCHDHHHRIHLYWQRFVLPVCHDIVRRTNDSFGRGGVGGGWLLPFQQYFSCC